MFLTFAKSSYLELRTAPSEEGKYVKRQNWLLARIFIIGVFSLIWTLKMNGNNISISHSVNIVMSQLIISYCFWWSYLTGYLFLIVMVNLIWRQMLLRKLRFAARYRYISIMLLRWLITKKMTLPYKNWSCTGISWI